MSQSVSLYSTRICVPTSLPYPSPPSTKCLKDLRIELLVLSPSKPHHLSFRNLRSENGLLIIYFLAMSSVIWGQDLVVIYKKASKDDKCSALVIWLEHLLSSSTCLFFFSMPPVTRFEKDFCTSRVQRKKQLLFTTFELFPLLPCHILHQNSVWSGSISNYGSKMPSKGLLIITHYALLYFISVISFLNNQACRQAQYKLASAKIHFQEMAFAYFEFFKHFWPGLNCPTVIKWPSAPWTPTVNNFQQ